jgi:hypothetical protein
MQTQPLFDLMAAAANRYAQMLGMQPALPRLAEAETEPVPDAPPANDEADISLANFQNLKFDFFYERVVSTGRQATFLEGDEARSISQDLYQKVTGRLTFDFSILSTLADETGRAANIDEETFKKFVDAASGLADFDDDSLQTFLQTVDELFNAAEKSLGMSADGLDDVAELMKDSVKSFFSDISTATQNLKNAEKDAASEFANQLQALLHPEEEASDDDAAAADGKLAQTGISDELRASLKTIGKLLSRLSRATDPERQEALLNRLQRVTDRAMKQAGQTTEDDEKVAVEPRALQIEQYSRAVERFTFNMQQSQLSLVA